MSTLTRDQALVGIPRHPCPHTPACPDWDSPAHDMAKVVDRHPELGYERLCNDVYVWDDLGEILPNGATVPAHSNEPPHAVTP